MLNRIATGIAALCLSTSVAAQAKDLMPPSYLLLGTFTSNSTLKFDCEGEGEAPYRAVACDLTLVSISRVTAEQKSKAKADLAQIDTMSDSDFRKASQQLADMDLANLRARMTKSTPEQATYLSDLGEAVKLLQGSRGRQAIKAAGAKMNELEENTCTVRLTRNQLRFQRVSERRWVSNPGPQGLCNVVTVHVLENDPAGAFLWKFTETTVSADVEKKACGFLKNGLNQAQAYSWDYPSTVAPGCKYMKVE